MNGPKSKAAGMMITAMKLLLIAAVLVRPAITVSAQKAEAWERWQKYDPGSKQTIDHGPWDRFLKQYVVSPHASGINRVRYQALTPDDLQRLRRYLESMQSVEISNFNHTEQKSYWINIYNALVVDLIFSRYPLASIRDINISPGLLARGPWGAKLLTIEGEKLSLDDIQHRILRPIWRDNRVHYALSYATLGGPNLQPEAFTGDNTDALLEKGAREFINHPRGVTVGNGQLRVSSIYIWFQEDFGGDAQGLMEHWQKYANVKLAEALQKYSGGLSHDYDWRLNGIDAVP